ncbi:MAG TPA: hypothetical protein VIC84_13975, partial [Blastocatellia bacterium]
YTRFILPAYPAMILGALLIARDVVDLFRKPISDVKRARLRWAVLAIFLGITLSHEIRYIKRFGLFNFATFETANYTSCRWTDQTIPSNSLVAAMQMSSALKFYTGRPVVRWDWLMSDRWPAVKKHAAERGYQWYALLLPFEIEDAQKKIGGRWTKIGARDQVSLWRIELASDR